MPGGFRLIRPKRPRAYPSENALVREMGGACGPPPWAKRVRGGGDAAYGSQAPMRMGQDRDPADPPRPGRCVFALTRPWTTVEAKTLKNLVPHVPRQYAHRTPVPRATAGQGRSTCWT